MGSRDFAEETDIFSLDSLCLVKATTRVFFDAVGRRGDPLRVNPAKNFLTYEAVGLGSRTLTKKGASSNPWWFKKVGGTRRVKFSGFSTLFRRGTHTLCVGFRRNKAEACTHRGRRVGKGSDF